MSDRTADILTAAYVIGFIALLLGAGSRAMWLSLRAQWREERAAKGRGFEVVSSRAPTQDCIER